jgi:hypothetical protein
MKRSLILLLASSIAGAQAPAPLRGVTYDSLHGRPLVGAFVGIAGMNINAVSDSLGRFVLAAVPRGTHRVVMQHDVLDAIGMSAAGARAVVTGRGDSVIVAVPSYPTLWRTACGGTPPASTDSGFVYGTVMSRGQAVPGATVSASWIDLFQDSTKAVRQKQMLMEVEADSTGTYALCGVPTTTGLSVRATINNYASVWAELLPLDKERIARKDISIIGLGALREEKRW